MIGQFEQCKRTISSPFLVFGRGQTSYVDHTTHGRPRSDDKLLVRIEIFGGVGRRIGTLERFALQGVEFAQMTCAIAVRVAEDEGRFVAAQYMLVA